jgi:hypothetical protein
MNRSILAVVLGASLAAALAAAPPEPVHSFAIVVGEGSSKHEVVTDKDIVAFNWPDQAMEVRADVLSRIKFKGLDTAFDLLVDGKLVYSGRFVSAASSKTYDVPTVWLEPLPAKEPTTVLTIQRAYYREPRYQTGLDVRFNDRIRESLKALGKLSLKPAKTAADPALTGAITAVLMECQSIVPGTTRAELLTMFVEEGGLSTPRRRTYAHRTCPYIKLDVEFEFPDSIRGASEERPTDRVKKISGPYLAWPIMD